MTEGCSYKIIAARCNISCATVNTHVSHIYEELQVKGVASAFNLGLREGLIRSVPCAWIRVDRDRSLMRG